MSTKTVLAIETSGKICSVSLCSFEYLAPIDKHIGFYQVGDNVKFQIISEYTINVGNKHDRLCAELCSRILKDNDMFISQLDAVAVSSGPGSFTGLRIGMAIAKGLCFNFSDNCDAKKENTLSLIAVPTLYAVAMNALTQLVNTNSGHLDDILAIVPSHSNLVYHQRFNFQGLAISDIMFSDIETAMRQSSPTDFIATSSRLEIVSNKYPPCMFQISSIAIARLAVSEYMKNNFTDANEIQPVYLTDFIPGKNSTTNC